MPKFNVRVTETLQYRLAVDAPDEATAQALAYEQVVNNPEHAGFVGCIDRSTEIEPKSE